jgi:hypothetical protein
MLIYDCENQYSASKDPRVKLTVLFNSGVLGGANTAIMASIKNPIAWFLGGPKDIGQKNVSGLYDH